MYAVFSFLKNLVTTYATGCRKTSRAKRKYVIYANMNSLNVGGVAIKWTLKHTLSKIQYIYIIYIIIISYLFLHCFEKGKYFLAHEKINVLFYHPGRK